MGRRLPKSNHSLRLLTNPCRPSSQVFKWLLSGVRRHVQMADTLLWPGGDECTLARPSSPPSPLLASISYRRNCAFSARGCAPRLAACCGPQAALPKVFTVSFTMTRRLRAQEQRDKDLGLVTSRPGGANLSSQLRGMM